MWSAGRKEIWKGKVGSDGDVILWKRTMKRTVRKETTPSCRKSQKEETLFYRIIENGELIERHTMNLLLIFDGKNHGRRRPTGRTIYFGEVLNTGFYFLPFLTIHTEYNGTWKWYWTAMTRGWCWLYSSTFLNLNFFESFSYLICLI